MYNDQALVLWSILIYNMEISLMVVPASSPCGVSCMKSLLDFSQIQIGLHIIIGAGIKIIDLITFTQDEEHFCLT